MPRSYQHIKQYENEIIEMRQRGLTYNKIADNLGMSYEQIRGFFKKEVQEPMLKAGKVIHKKGRPCKNRDGGLPTSIQRLDKLAQMRHVLASYRIQTKTKLAPLEKRNQFVA